MRVNANHKAREPRPPPTEKPTWRTWVDQTLWENSADGHCAAANDAAGPGWEGEHCSPFLTVPWNQSTGALFRVPRAEAAAAAAARAATAAATAAAAAGGGGTGGGGGGGGGGGSRNVSTDDVHDPLDGPPHGFATDILYNERWTKYFESVVRGWSGMEGQEAVNMEARQKRLRLALGQWICRTWNTKHGDGPFFFGLFFVSDYDCIFN